MQISSAEFECSAPDLDSCPDESLPEFAFIGRSNVGKSSLLNMLAGKNGLARVSPTPGFTKLINFFTMNQTWRLVDLPGYGYAKVARKDSSRFNRAVSEYLRDRTSLCCVFALIDSGLPPQEIDVEFLDWLVRHAVPFVIVFTKTDAATPEVVQQNIKAFTDRVSPWFEKAPTMFTCSANSGHGRRELLGVVDEALTAIQREAQARMESLPPGTEPSPGDLPPATRKEKQRAARPRRPNPARPW